MTDMIDELRRYASLWVNDPTVPDDWREANAPKVTWGELDGVAGMCYRAADVLLAERSQREAAEREIAEAREACPSVRMQDHMDAPLLALVNLEVSRGFNRDAELHKVAAEMSKLRDWRSTVTVALGRPGGAHYDDVAGHIRELRAERDSLTAALAELRAEKDRAAVTAALRAAGDAGTMRRLASQATAARDALADFAAEPCYMSVDPLFQCAENEYGLAGYCHPCRARLALAETP